MRAPLLYSLRSWVALSFKVCEWVRHLWHQSRSPLCSIYKGIYKCLTLDYYYNYYRVTWWLDRIFCGRTRSHLAKFYESLHLLTDWEFVLGIQIIATTATEGNMPGKSKKKLRHMCTSDFERVYLESCKLLVGRKILNQEQLLLRASVATYNCKSMPVFTS